MRKIIFILGYLIGSPLVLKNILKSKKLRSKSYREIEEYQLFKTRNYLIEAYENTTYYKELFDNISFNPYEFNNLSEMSKIPILNKQLIKSRIEDFYNKRNVKYKTSKSGGSTGEPLEFRLSHNDAAWSRALLFNGFHYAGYRLGDSMITIAGGSLVSSKISTKKKIMDFILNQKTITTLNLTSDGYKDIIEQLKKHKPKYLRGYASSIYRIAKFISENNYKFDYRPNAIFTTSETLSSQQRRTIESVFKSKVFDQYGLNDSGASAFQIETDKYLIDYERSLVELIDDGDSKRIISTSYSNDAMFFIRYDTGDNLILTEEYIYNKKVAQSILGRTSESLSLNGVDISVPRLTIILADLSIDRYQIKQNNNKFDFYYTGNLSTDDEEFIINFFDGLFGKSFIGFHKINEEQFVLTKNGKHKYII